MKFLHKRIFYPGFDLNIRVRRSIQRFFLNEPNTTTLDVGCGNGFFSLLAARRGSQVLGISREANEVARCQAYFSQTRQCAGRLEFRQLNAAQVRELGLEFDQILLLEVLEHIDDDASLLRSLAEILKPGGVLHLSVPDVTLGILFGGLDRYARGGHCRLGYHAERLCDLLRGCGLDIAHQSRVGHLGNYLVVIQTRIWTALGCSLTAQMFAFLVVFPLFWMLSWIPIPHRWRPTHYVLARKPIGPNRPV